MLRSFLAQHDRYISAGSPQLPQPMGSQLGTAVAREHALHVHATHAPDALRGLEIAQVPDVLANHEWLAPQDRDIALEHVGLILFAEHFGRLGMMAGHCVCAELGQDERLAIFLVQRIEFRRNGGRALLDLTRLRVPTGVAVETDDVAELECLLADRRTAAFRGARRWNCRERRSNGRESGDARSRTGSGSAC